jgi:mannose-1-phosphate guanylyltransferase
MDKSAILLVGGFGTRLAPLTHLTPKPMLHVAGIPFTEHQIVKARAAGISEIVLATSYLAEVFEPYFGDGEKFGIKISYAVEREALGTGGAIANAAKLLRGNGPVFIFNGDVLSSHDLSAQLDLHLAQKADVTLHLTQVEDARAFGAVEMTGDQILSFNEKMENPPTNIINAGCYIFNREIIDGIPSEQVVSVERETFPALLSAGSKVFGYLDSSYWLDIGTPSALLKATSDLILGKAHSLAFDELLAGGSYLKMNGSLVAKSAQVSQSALIQAGSVIGEGAQIGAKAQIARSVIGSHSRIGEECQLADTFVAENSQIPAAFIAESQFFGFSRKK